MRGYRNREKCQGEGKEGVRVRQFGQSVVDTLSGMTN